MLYSITARTHRKLATLAGACSALSILLLPHAAPLLAETVPSTFQERIDAAARALEKEPRVGHLSLQQRQALTEFVVGNMLFVVAHELGHAAISEMNLPVLGGEEDAADSFAIITGLTIGTAFSHRVLVEAARGWFLTDRRETKEGEPLACYDEHGLNKQRAYQIVCLMVGSDPTEFKDLAEETKLPEDCQASCRRDYRVASRSWDAVLKPHLHAAEKKTPIEVAYDEGKGDLALFARTFRDIGFLEAIAARAAEKLDWNGPLGLKMRSCGEVNAYWNKPDRTVHICYEMAQEFAQLYRDYGPDRKFFKQKRSQ